MDHTASDRDFPVLVPEIQNPADPTQRCSPRCTLTIRAGPITLPEHDLVLLITGFAATQGHHLQAHPLPQLLQKDPPPILKLQGVAVTVLIGADLNKTHFLVCTHTPPPLQVDRDILHQ
jgi:hypothetical protein